MVCFYMFCVPLLRLNAREAINFSQDSVFSRRCRTLDRNYNHTWKTMQHRFKINIRTNLHHALVWTASVTGSISHFQVCNRKQRNRERRQNWCELWAEELRSRSKSWSSSKNQSSLPSSNSIWPADGNLKLLKTRQNMQKTIYTVISQKGESVKFIKKICFRACAGLLILSSA